MRDPEMCFEVETDPAGQIIELYPYYFLNDGMHIEYDAVERTGTDADGRMTHLALLKNDPG